MKTIITLKYYGQVYSFIHSCCQAICKIKISFAYYVNIKIFVSCHEYMAHYDRKYDNMIRK